MKKWISKLLSVIVVISLISGCGTMNNDVPNNEDQTPMNENNRNDQNDNSDLNRDENMNNNNNNQNRNQDRDDTDMDIDSNQNSDMNDPEVNR